MLGITTLYFSLRDAIWPSFILIIPLALLLTRLFILQHDLGHGNLFKQIKYNDIVGVLIGIIPLTSYHFWRQAHAIHPVRGGNADKRPWPGDVNLLTVGEYRTKSRWSKLSYKLYRDPFVMFFYCGKRSTILMFGGSTPSGLCSDPHPRKVGA